MLQKVQAQAQVVRQEEEQVHLQKERVDQSKKLNAMILKQE